MNITRFAPSPTGFLHLGHAFSALFAAQNAGHSMCGLAPAAPTGQFILRMEDIDTTRCKPAFTTAIEEDLKWLGLQWQIPVRHQSLHLPEYAKSLKKLQAQELLYPCFCTRKDVATESAAASTAPHIGPNGPLYKGTCRTLSWHEQADKLTQNLPHVWRLKMDEAIKRTGKLTWHDREKGEVETRPEEFGDVILARKDCMASYHLCATHDDAAQGITLVTRGEDLIRATDIHRLLQALLELPTPAYHHHRLLCDANGRRYAKRDKALTLQQLRNEGISATALKTKLGF